MEYRMLKTFGHELAQNIDEAAALYAVRLAELKIGEDGFALHEKERIHLIGLFASCFETCCCASFGKTLFEYVQVRLKKGVDLRPVVQGILSSKSVFKELGRRIYGQGNDYLVFIDELDDFYISFLAGWAELYSNMLLSRLDAEHGRNKLLLEASRTVTSALDADEMLKKLAEVLAGTVTDGCCTIFLVDSETGGLGPGAGFGYVSKECRSALRGLRLCPSGNTLKGINGESYGLCAANKAGSSFADRLPDAVRSGSKQLFPISNYGATIGVALVSSARQGFTFDSATEELIEGILNAVAVAVESAANVRNAKRQLKESESLRRVANILLQSPEGKNGEVLTLIADEARSIVDGEGSALLLLKGDSLNYVYGAGAPFLSSESYSLEGSFYGTVFLSGETTPVRDAQSEIPAGECLKSVRTLIAVPLRDGDKKLGLLLVTNKAGGFDRLDSHTMEMFAAQAVLSMRNSRFFEQSEKLIVQDERQRLARELHDSVTQALYAITFCSDAAIRSLDAGKGEVAGEQLKALQGMSRQAMRDMRSLIFDLHPPELESEGLVGALQARLNAVEVRSGLIAELLVEGNERRLPLRVEEEIFRIAIEALNNATKHSKAESINVKIVFGEGVSSLYVIDDGCGFDMESLPKGGMGLRGIRERAQNIDAVLDIRSVSGEGTCVRIDVGEKPSERGVANE